MTKETLEDYSHNDIHNRIRRGQILLLHKNRIPPTYNAVYSKGKVVPLQA
jgi:hypothetical protein